VAQTASSSFQNAVASPRLIERPAIPRRRFPSDQANAQTPGVRGIFFEAIYQTDWKNSCGSCGNWPSAINSQKFLFRKRSISRRGLYHCLFEIRLCAARRGHGRPGRVETGLLARAQMGTQEHANAQRRCLRIGETY